MNNKQDSQTINDLLITGTGKDMVDHLSAAILKRPSIFRELLRIVMENKEPESRKAAWVIDTFTQNRMEWLSDHDLTLIIEQLDIACHTAICRHILRILTRAAIPEQGKGRLISDCFNFLLSPAAPVAVKVHAMSILFSLSKEEPDLLQELTGILELRMDLELPGFRNHAKKILLSVYQKK